MEYELEEEIKLLEVDHGKLLKSLVEVGAMKDYETIMTIVSFDFLGKLDISSVPLNLREVLKVAYKFYQNSGSLRKNNAHLRLRFFTHNDKIEFTFKCNIDDAHDTILKQAKEYNAYLFAAEADYLKKHIEQLGLAQNALHEKKRESYILPNGCVCDIDTYPNIPTYVELEGSQKVVVDGIAMLGLSGNKVSRASGANFFADYDQEFYSKLVF